MIKSSIPQDLFTQNSGHPRTILEVGSNLLDKKGQSYLGSLIAPKHLKRLNYSDFSKEIVAEDTRKKKNIPYLHVDATRFSDTITPASLAHIVSVNVLDTIAREKLSAVVEGAYQSLKIDGKVVVLSDQHYDPMAMFKKHSTEENFAFPFATNTKLGLKIVSKRKLLEKVELYGTPFKDFILSLLQQPIEKQLYFLMRQFTTKTNLNVVLDRLCDPSDYTIIDHEQSYLDDLKEAFATHAGFDIIQNDYQEKSVVLSENSYPTHINTIRTDLRIPALLRPGFSRDLKANELCLTAVFHVFIAQKIQR